MQKYELGQGYKNIFFIGIGGIHMSGMAELLHAAGYTVSGSDQKNSAAVEKLKSLGIHVYIGHNAENITKNIDVVVYTAAVPSTNTEMISAKEKGILVMVRAEMLGLMMKNFKCPVCVSGTHGKTTTTSMLSEIFINAEEDPTCVIGGVLPSIGGALRISEKMDTIIVESCEYYDAFLKFFPFVGIILNIELDHTDYFGSIERIRKSFRKFAERIPYNGALVICCDINNIDEIINGLPCRVITYGTDNADWYAENISFDSKGFASFTVFHKGKVIGEVKLSVPGSHNVLNSLSCIAASDFLGLSFDCIKEGILRYSGTNRRFQYKGTINGINVYDDYCHHPTEIKATIASAMNMKYNKLWCIFQPHTKKRTKELLNNFAVSFKGADGIILLDIYSPAGREESDCFIHSTDLMNKILENGQEAYYFTSFLEAKTFILQNLFHNDMLITMGAGDVVFLGESLFLDCQ